METLTFFFDPLCPWTWRTSQWVREVQRQQPLDVTWRFFSLGEANNFGGAWALAPLRVAALARRDGGNEAVDRVYRAMGRAIHESGVNTRAEGALESAIKQGLDEAGLDATLLARAMDDPSTRDEVLADHREAAERYGAYGVPWLVLAGQDFGFNGPIISAVPRDQSALDLWSGVSALLVQPYFYELKRNRS